MIPSDEAARDTLHWANARMLLGSRGNSLVWSQPVRRYKHPPPPALSDLILPVCLLRCLLLFPFLSVS